MKKSVRIVLIVSASAIALYMGAKHLMLSSECSDGICGPHKMICDRSLEEQFKPDRQIKMKDISVVKVSAETSGEYSSDEHVKYACVHKVKVTQQIFGVWQVPSTFQIAEDKPINNLACSAVGSQFFVIMHKAALRGDIKNCAFTAIVDLSKQDELFKLIAQSKEEK